MTFQLSEMDAMLNVAIVAFAPVAFQMHKSLKSWKAWKKKHAHKLVLRFRAQAHTHTHMNLISTVGTMYLHMNMRVYIVSLWLVDGLLSEAQSAQRHAAEEEQGEEGAGGERRRAAVGARGRTAAQLPQQLLAEEQQQEEEDWGEQQP